MVPFNVEKGHSEHPDLEYRKQILARWLLTRDLVWRHGVAHGVLASELAQHGAKTAMVRAAATETLSEFLKGVLADVAAMAALRKSPANMLDHLQASMGGIDCAICAADRNGKPCYGGFGDRKLMAAQPPCLDPIKQDFEAMARVASQAYGPILLGGSTDLRLDLALEAILGEVITGGTSFPDDRVDQRRARVSFGFPYETFGEDQLGHAIYVMFHEVFVHGPEGWHGETERFPSNDRCALREGFVDAAGVALLLERLPEDPGLGWMHELVDRLSAAIEFAHLRRVHMPSLPPGAGVRQLVGIVSNRLEGRSWFTTLDAVGFKKEACRLAMALNALNLTQIQKGALIPVLDRMVRSAAKEERAARAGTFKGLLRELLDLVHDPRAFRVLVERKLIVNEDF